MNTCKKEEGSPMPKKKPATRKRKSKAPIREYRPPKTATELGITCSIYGQPAEWFCRELGQVEHLKGFTCTAHKQGPSEKLLIKTA
jgi:hypothetical protein